MGKKSAPAPPPAPDYYGLARQQHDLDLDAAERNARINRPDQITPYGRVTYTEGPNGTWEQNTRLTGLEGRIFDDNQLQRARLADLGSTQADLVRRTLGSPLGTGGLPERITDVNTPEYQEGVASADFQRMTSDPSFQRYGNDPRFQRFDQGPLQGSDYQMGVDFSGAPQMPGDYVGQRDEVIDTVNRLASRELDPRYQQEEEALRTRLLNSGVTEGSEAYTRSLDDFYRRKDSAYGDARDRAILLGGQEQSRMFGDTLSARDQAIAEELASGSFSNNAAELANRYGIDARTLAMGELAYNNDLGRLETDYGRDRIRYGNELEGMETDYGRNRVAYNNDLEQLGFGNRMSQADLRNQSRSRAYADELSRAGLRNNQREAQLQENVMLRELPMGEMLSLQPYMQAQFPNQANVPQVSGPGGAPIMDAALAQNQHAMNLYGQQVGQVNAHNQGLTNLATTGVMTAAMIY